MSKNTTIRIVNGWTYRDDWDERGELILYRDPVGKEEEATEAPALLVIGEGNQHPEVTIGSPWISVEERLPEMTGVDVLVANEYGVGLEAHRWNNVQGWIPSVSGPECGLEEITHWMPLPSPPKL